MHWLRTLIHVLLIGKSLVNNNIEINYVLFEETKMNDAKYDWKSLDTVCRQWAVLSQHQKDLKNYAELAERI